MKRVKNLQCPRGAAENKATPPPPRVGEGVAEGRRARSAFETLQLRMISEKDILGGRVGEEVRKVKTALRGLPGHEPVFEDTDS